MSIIDHEINKRIMHGKFPGVELMPAPFEEIEKIDFKRRAEESFEILNRNPARVLNKIEEGWARMEKNAQGNGEYTYINRLVYDINFLINTGYDKDLLNPNYHLEEAASSLNPVVTAIDKIIWHIIQPELFVKNDVGAAISDQNYYSLFMWVYCLLQVEEKEFDTGKTIDVSKLDISSPLPDLLTGAWDGHEEFLKSISSIEKRKIRSLMKKRRELDNWIEEDRICGEFIAKKTEEEWSLLFRIIQNLAQKESVVIDSIVNDKGSYDKLKAINSYRSSIQLMLSGKYNLDGEIVDIAMVHSAAVTRLLHASAYTKVYSNDMAPFYITPDIINFLGDPTGNYNYLFIAYHRLRLLQSQEAAEEFSKLVLLALENNLQNNIDYDIYEEKGKEIDYYIEKIHSLVTCFVYENREKIQRQSFLRVQEDTIPYNTDGVQMSLFNEKMNTTIINLKEAAVGLAPQVEDLVRQLFPELQDQWTDGTMTELMQMELEKLFWGREPDDYEDRVSTLIEKLPIYGKGPELGDEKVYEIISELSEKMEDSIVSGSAFQSIADNFSEISNELKVNQIVMSVNILYLFCDALQIMLSSQVVELRDAETVRRYRYELQDLDSFLVNSFYSHLEDNAERISEIREKKGIAVTELERAEIKEEKSNNSTFAEILRTSIEALVSDIEKQDADKLLETKTTIRQVVGACPACSAKEDYAEWLDEISERLGRLLVAKYKDEESFDSVKATVIDYIGEKSEKLPDGTIDSLVTAEILYNKYANEEFASAGFEYSSISALYYQAFEEAYNNLIWKEYARKLNLLEVDGESFTDWLNKHHKDEYINDDRFKGYLPSKINYRRNYIGYNKKEDVVRINKFCMFMSFAILMENIDKDRKLDKFCDYFAKLGGYNSRKEMFSDDSFMRACKNFTSCLKDSVDHRNNASHGGTPIDMNRCAEDKKAVLNKVQMDRKENWGLIQQLLGLLQ